MLRHTLLHLARGAALLSLCANLQAAVINVNIAGGGDYTSIQPAIDAAVDGDEIVVHPGLYRERIAFNGKDIVVRSADPLTSSVVASTVIDSEQMGSTVTFDGNEPATACLSGFMVIGGGGPLAVNGGGVNGAGTSATISHNHIAWNRATTNGGGLYRCHGAITDNTILGNVTEWGDGGGLFECNGLIEGNVIENNRSECDGGGAAWCLAIIRGNYFRRNNGNHGAALYESGTLIEQNDFQDNKAEMSGGAVALPAGRVIGNVFAGNESSSGGGGGVYGSGHDIEGNTFERNWAGTGGGAIHWCVGSVRDNRITHNGAGWDGGGLSSCLSEVSHNLIAWNITFIPTQGGNGAGATDLKGWVHHNTFLANEAAGGGGAIWYSHGTFEYNSFINNSARNGGAFSNCSGVIRYNTIAANRATNGGALTGFEGEIKGNLFDDNRATRNMRYFGSGGAASHIKGTVSGNTFINNEGADGGAINHMVGVVESNRFLDNTARTDGGAMHMTTGTIRGNYFSGNSAGEFGGGLSNASGTIANNVLSGNTATTGGAIGLSSAAIANNTIWANSADVGGGLYACFGDIRNCILWNNTATTDSQVSNGSAPVYSCIQDWPTTDSGNITSDPMLRSPATGDFTLAAGSPCIDAGDPVEAWNDACLPPGLATVRNDMGAYGGPFNCVSAGFPGSAAAIVDYILTGWGVAAFCDRNGDGVVDVADVTLAGGGGP